MGSVERSGLEVKKSETVKGSRVLVFLVSGSLAFGLVLIGALVVLTHVGPVLLERVSQELLEHDPHAFSSRKSKTLRGLR